MSYIGTNKVGKMYLGSTAIGKAYLGDDLVFDSTGATPVLPYDAEIAYLQSSGTQYINTGIVQVSRNFEVRMKLQWVGVTASQFESFFAYMAAGSNITPRSGLHKYQGTWMFGTNTTTITSTVINGSVHDILWISNASTQKEQLFLDGTKIGEGTTASTGLSTNTIPFFIGCRNRNGSTDNPTSMRIMSLNYKYFSDSAHTTLVQEWDFVPVRVGTTGYMYDKISGTLFGNSGTGSFILGNDKVPEPVLPTGYTQLDYVQGVTRVISTNISPVNSQWEFDVVCDSSTTSNEVIICTGVGYGGQFAAACGNGKWGLGTGAGYYTSVNVTTRSTIYVTYTSNGITMTIGNETVSRTGTNGHTNNPFLFGANGSGLFSSGKIYSVKCLSGGNFNGVPAQRISDNKKGLYDTANDVFYSLT